MGGIHEDRVETEGIVGTRTGLGVETKGTIGGEPGREETEGL
jgi:hypothetical protein